jgi:hypothetical protein
LQIGHKTAFGVPQSQFKRKLMYLCVNLGKYIDPEFVVQGEKEFSAPYSNPLKYV